MKLRKLLPPGIDGKEEFFKDSGKGDGGGAGQVGIGRTAAVQPAFKVELTAGGDTLHPLGSRLQDAPGPIGKSALTGGIGDNGVP